jgi:hypothetical protein
VDVGGRLSPNAAVFRTENRNVIFTVDATTIPPLYNQDDSQRVNGVSLTIGASTAPGTCSPLPISTARWRRRTTPIAVTASR